MGKVNPAKKSLAERVINIVLIVLIGLIIGTWLSSLHIQTGVLPVKFGNQVYADVITNPAPQTWCSESDRQPKEVYAGWPFVRTSMVDDTACSRFGSFSYEYLYPMGEGANILVGICLGVGLIKVWFLLMRVFMGVLGDNPRYAERNHTIAGLLIYIVLGCLVWISIVVPSMSPPSSPYIKSAMPFLINIPGETIRILRSDTTLSPADCMGVTYGREFKQYYGFPIITKVRVVAPDNPCLAVKYIETAYPIGIWINILTVTVLFIRGYFKTKQIILADIEIAEEKGRIT
ncbi:hypothetical protein IPP75_03465 [Candidatus Saccharibacteria bacterium]|nr:MAG: hypothetical protein IPP75_03465 [Candidatus Saccharibacteria bacterium]